MGSSIGFFSAELDTAELQLYTVNAKVDATDTLAVGAIGPETSGIIGGKPKIEIYWVIAFSAEIRGTLFGENAWGRQ